MHLLPGLQIYKCIHDPVLRKIICNIMNHAKDFFILEIKTEDDTR